MLPPKPGADRLRIALWLAIPAVVLLAAGFFVLRAWSGSSAPEPAKLPPLLTLAEGDWLYTFHVPTGAEELFDIRADPGRTRNLATGRPAETARLRKLLSEELGVADLEDLRRAPTPVTDALRGNGYL